MGKSLWLGPMQWLATVWSLKILGHWYMDWDAAGHRANIGSVTALQPKDFLDSPISLGTARRKGLLHRRQPITQQSGVIDTSDCNGFTGKRGSSAVWCFGYPWITARPRLFSESSSMVYTIMYAMLLANVVMAFMMICSMRWLAKIASFRPFLLPVILVFCVICSYALSNRF